MTEVPLESLQSLIEPGPQPCTISMPCAEGRTAVRRSHLCRADADGVSVTTPAGDRDAIRRLIEARTPILVNARRDDGERLFYAAPLTIVENGGDEPETDLTTLALPDKVLATQRRSYFRVPINPGDDVHARVWKINNYVLVRDRALPSQECPCELLDLSAGGMRVAIRARGQNALNLVQDQRFKIELATPKREMILEGRLRYPRETARDDVMALCGIRFVHRDNIESRANLQHLHVILAQLQRAAVRNRAA